MGQEEQKHSLVDGLQDDFLLPVVEQEQTVVFCDEQTAQLSASGFDTQLFQQRHTQRLQNQVVPVLQLQSRQQLLQFSCQLLGRPLLFFHHSIV